MLVWEEHFIICLFCWAGFDVVLVWEAKQFETPQMRRREGSVGLVAKYANIYINILLK